MEKIQEVPTADSGTNTEPLEKVQYDTEYNVFANERQHFKQPESINNTCVVEKVDSNVILDSPDMCNNDNQAGQNAKACDDERVALANLITNLKLNIDENKKIQNQLKKANASLIQELKECKTTLKETNRTLGESNSTRDSCLISLPNKQIELEMYKTLNDRTIDYDKLEQDMELESINSGPTVKLPIIKFGEYEMWAMRIKQYFQIQDYALWEVIENGNSWVPISQTTKENGITTLKMSTPATAKEK
ncbi:hypothetical protein Tco_1221869, partial [Tanacetum coccineum]